MTFDLQQYLLYWIIRLLVLLSFVVPGLWMSKRYNPERLYWIEVSPLIVIYSLAEGLRWNRENDYYHYYQDLTGSMFHDSSEWFYSLWISFFKSTGLPFWVGFVFYSFILIVAFLCLIKRFPKTALFALPLFFIITSVQSENLIRQYFALAFIIFAIAYYFDERYILMTVFLLISLGIHFSAVAPILFFIISIMAANRINTEKPIISVSLFVLLYWFWDVSYFTTIANSILGIIPETGTRADGYIQSATWFTAEGSIMMKEFGQVYGGRGILRAIIEFPTYLFIIIGGFYATKNDIKLRVCFWCAYIAILLDITRGDIESYLRIFQWIAFIISIIIGAIYSKIQLSNNMKIISLSLIFVYYGYMMMFCRMLTIDPLGYAFIWDR